MSNDIVIVKHILQVCISLDTEINFERELRLKDKTYDKISEKSQQNTLPQPTHDHAYMTGSMEHLINDMHVYKGLPVVYKSEIAKNSFTFRFQSFVEDQKQFCVVHQEPVKDVCGNDVRPCPIMASHWVLTSHMIDP